MLTIVIMYAPSMTAYICMYVYRYECMYVYKYIYIYVYNKDEGK